MSKKTAESAPESAPESDPSAAPPAPTFVGDEHWGKGGNYIVVDGKRVPAPAEPQSEQPAVEEQDHA